MADKIIKVKLKKSIITENPKAKKTVRALGLRKINQIKEHKDTPQIRGMINKVNYLVEIVEE